MNTKTPETLIQSRNRSIIGAGILVAAGVAGLKIGAELNSFALEFVGYASAVLGAVAAAHGLQLDRDYDNQIAKMHADITDVLKKS